MFDFDEDINELESVAERYPAQSKVMEAQSIDASPLRAYGGDPSCEPSIKKEVTIADNDYAEPPVTKTMDDSSGRK